MLCVLGYHVLNTPGKEHPVYNKVTTADFEDTVSFFKENGYRTLFTQELAADKKCTQLKHEKIVVFTFDDCHESVVTYGCAILKKYDFKGCFGVTTSWVGKVNPIRGFKYTTWQQLSQLQAAGMEIVNHTHTHKETHSSISSLVNDIKKAKSSCVENHIRLSDTVIYPYGKSLKFKTLLKKPSEQEVVRRLKMEGVCVSFKTQPQNIYEYNDEIHKMTSWYNVPRLMDQPFSTIKRVIASPQTKIHGHNESK